MSRAPADGKPVCSSLSLVLAEHDKPGRPAARLLRFGVFELDTRAGELRKRAVRLRLQGQPLQVLEILLRRTGDVVTREELRAQLWTSDTFVDFEHSLHNAIARLRDMLGDSARAPRYIQTLPRRGYKFLAPVEAVESDVSAGQLHVAGPDPKNIRSLSVLPLADLSGDPAQGYFADGMTEALITSLAKIEKLRVISRTSVMQYRGTRKSLPRIARELNVDAVLEGSVLRSGERIRITAQLIHAPSDQHLWAASYERDFRDVLSLQDEIARHVAGQVRIMLTPEERARLQSARPVDPQAHELLLKGRYHRNKRTEENVKKALSYFDRAIASDSTWSEGYVGVADCYNMLGYYCALSPQQAYSKSESAAQKALQLDSSRAEAHAALGVVKRDYEWDWSGAEQQFQRALELNPGCVEAYHWRGTLFGMQHRHAEGLRDKEKALSLDPLSVIFRTDVGRLHYFERLYDPALEHYLAALEMDPHFFFVHILLGQAYLQKGMFKSALAALKTAARLSDDSTFALARLAQGYAIAGEPEKALLLLKRLHGIAARKYVAPFEIALIHVGLMDYNEAFAWLEKAFDQRSIWLGYLQVEPQLDPVRDDPRFRELLQRMRFT
jgi:TolB-like protein/tetratricopeptide (TPR) repeat protein